MRKKVIIGNWKMNNGPREGYLFFEKLNNLIKNEKHYKPINVDFAIAAPFLSLPFLLPKNHLKHSVVEIPLAAQNFNENESGAYTGEISLPMLEQIGIKYAIVGHSERRQYFHETNENINKKLISALKTKIIPIFAFGETLQQFEEGNTLQVIKKQLTECLKDISSLDISRIIFAYEPIWAIGTGKTATNEQAEYAIKNVRLMLEQQYGSDVANKTIILYGGSVNSENVRGLLYQPNIDGALVGGYSNTPENFLKLIYFDQN